MFFWWLNVILLLGDMLISFSLCTWFFTRRKATVNVINQHALLSQNLSIFSKNRFRPGGSLNWYSKRISGRSSIYLWSRSSFKSLRGFCPSVEIYWDEESNSATWYDFSKSHAYAVCMLTSDCSDTCRKIHLYRLLSGAKATPLLRRELTSSYSVTSVKLEAWTSCNCLLYSKLKYLFTSNSRFFTLIPPTLDILRVSWCIVSLLSYWVSSLLNN